MKKLVFLLVIFIVFFSYLNAKNKILFPKRQKINLNSKEFFNQVNLKNPALSKVKFFVESENYYSAYIFLTKYVKAQDYFVQLLNELKSLVKDMKFDNESFKKTSINRFEEILMKNEINNLFIVIKLMERLIDDYNNNQLSGNESYKLWNFILKTYLYSYKMRKNNLYNNACIKLVSSLNIFKKSYKYKKRSNKYYKKFKDKIKEKLIKKIFEL